MPHLHILYFFITVLLGIISLVVNSYIYLKYRIDFIKYFLYFHLAFTFDILFAGLLMYISINMTASPEVIHLLVYQLAVLMHFILMFSIPLFLHDLCKVPNAKIKNIIFTAITVITYIHSFYSEFITNDEQWALFGEYTEALIFISFVMYAFFVGIYYYSKLNEEIRKRIVFKILILLGLLIPGIIYDTIPNLSRSIIFPQLLYCGMGLILAYHLLKHYPFKSENAMRIVSINNTDALSENDFFSVYNLSKREQEIASLLLQGYNNKKITQTLYIALPTVKTHIHNMFSKFGVNSRYELLILFKNSQLPDAADPQIVDSAG